MVSNIPASRRPFDKNGGGMKTIPSSDSSLFLESVINSFCIIRGEGQSSFPEDDLELPCSKKSTKG